MNAILYIYINSQKIACLFEQSKLRIVCRLWGEKSKNVKNTNSRMKYDKYNIMGTNVFEETKHNTIYYFSEFELQD